MAKRAILADPVASLDADGRLVKLHCGTPGENCQLDDAKDKQTLPWDEALIYIIAQFRGTLRPFLCTYCFGGEPNESRQRRT